MALSFRTKLLLAMTLVVVGVSGSTLYVTQKRVQASYQKVFQEQFENQITFFSTLQEARLGAIKDQCLKLANSVRLVAAMNEEQIDAPLLYQTAMDELREVLTDEMREAMGEKMDGHGRNSARRSKASFFRFLDGNGKVLAAPNMNRLANRHRLDQQLAFVHKGMTGTEQQHVGYLAIAKNEDPGEDDLKLQEVIVTKVLDASEGKVLGALVIGFPVPDLIPRVRNTTNQVEQIHTGILLEGHLYAASNVVAQPLRPLIAQTIREDINKAKRDNHDFNARLANKPYRIFYDALNENSAFPEAYQVCIYSREQELKDEKDLTGRILGLGAVALIGAFILNLILSHGFAGPIEAVARGTEEIKKGNFEVRVPVRTRDEIGQLTASFNEMAEGLAQRERFRAVLNVVADKNVAQKLMSGGMALGGEVRDVSVLFCDIRGFTALTQDMPPDEVIQMLNEHMTILTRVVHQHNGAVDKFVGDLIMALFGAPESYGNDAQNAAQCALRMIEERAAMNKTSKHKIEMGIGIASGKVVAGCMGSIDRLNYTVLGGRVNLASRLCSQAGRMEVIIDQTTKDSLGASLAVEAMPALKLKGFTDAVPAYRLLNGRSHPDIA